jgi:hypothetical protein
MFYLISINNDIAKAQNIQINRVLMRMGDAACILRPLCYRVHGAPNMNEQVRVKSLEQGLTAPNRESWIDLSSAKTVLLLIILAFGGVLSLAWSGIILWFSGLVVGMW